MICLNNGTQIKLRKGYKIYFVKRDETETILKGSTDRTMGTIKTRLENSLVDNDYSVDFICRWLEFGYCKLIEVSMKDIDKSIGKNSKKWR